MFKEIRLPIAGEQLLRKPVKTLEKNQAEEAKNGDLAVKNALIYCDILDLFDKKAKECKKSKKERAELSLLLFHSYFSQKELIRELNDSPILQTRYSAHELNSITDAMKPKIELIKKRRNEQKFGAKEKAIAAYKVYRRTLGRKNLCEAQKQNLLKEIGYSEEGMKIAEKITTSAKLTAILFPVYSGAEAAALGTVFANNWINVLPSNLSEENLKIALGISIIADVLLATVDAAMDIKLLRKKCIGTSPDLPTTAIYYLLEKFMPAKNKTQNLAIILTSVIPTIIQDSIIRPMSPIIAKNIVKSTLQIIESLTKYAYLKKKEKEEKQAKDYACRLS